MSSAGKRSSCCVTHDITMPSAKVTASLCAILVLLGLMVGYAGVSYGTISAQNVVASYGTIAATSNAHNGLEVFQNSNLNYLENNGQIISSSSDATAIINTAIRDATSGDSILIDAGTYVMTSSISSQGKNGITLTLATGAVLAAGPGYTTRWTAGLITLANVQNWIIQGGEIDGTGGQGNSVNNGMTGIGISGCTNVTIQNMYIYNIRVYGIFFLNGCVGCEALNNNVAYVGANGIVLGFSMGSPYVQSYNLVAEGNTVEHCGDVGIDTQGVTNAQILYNTCAYMDTSNGYVNSHWGIGLEYHTVTALVQGNTVHDIYPLSGQGSGCSAGIAEMSATFSGNNVITGNNVYNCQNDYSLHQ